jgi:hypothetical protein
MVEASEMTEKLLVDSDKLIGKMQKDAAKQVDQISDEIVPELIEKMSH